jgi:hypothetical protein
MFKTSTGIYLTIGNIPSTNHSLNYAGLSVEMHRILILPDIRPDIRCRPDIRPDFQLNIQISCKIWNNQGHQMYQRFFFSRTYHIAFLHQSSNGSRRQFFEILWIYMVIYRYRYSIWPDIRLFLVSGIRPNIRQVKSGIQPDTGTGYKKRPGYPAGRISSASRVVSFVTNVSFGRDAPPPSPFWMDICLMSKPNLSSAKILSMCVAVLKISVSVLIVVPVLF